MIDKAPLPDTTPRINQNKAEEQKSLTERLKVLLLSLVNIKKETDQITDQTRKQVQQNTPEIDLSQKPIRKWCYELVTENETYEKINRATSYLAILLTPILDLLNNYQAEYLRGKRWDLDNAHLIITELTIAFFGWDTIINTLGKGRSYFRDVGSIINLVAIAADFLALTSGTLMVNPRFLRIVRLARLGKAVGMAHKAKGIVSNVLESACHNKISQRFAWALLLIVPASLMLGAKDIRLGEHRSLESNLSELALYTVLIIVVRMFSKGTRNDINSTYSKRFREATEDVLNTLEKVGIDARDFILKKMEVFQKEHNEEMNEIQIMSQVIGFIIQEMSKLMSGAGFQSVISENKEIRKIFGATLFTDIRNFSKISEFLDLEIFDITNRYYERNLSIIDKSGGDTDNLMGDAIFATFGSTDAALEATIKMITLEKAHSLSLVDRDAYLDGKAPNDFKDWEKLITTRFGLHFCESKAGILGSKDHRTQYTHIGDGVNLGARIEALCKHYHTDLLISEDFYEQLSPENQKKCRWIDYITVKGREKSPLFIYTIDLESVPTGFVELFEQARNLYLQGGWVDALPIFEEAHAMHPTDGPTRTFIDRINASREYSVKAGEYTYANLPNQMRRSGESLFHFTLDEMTSAIKDAKPIAPKNFVERGPHGGCWHWDQK